MDPQVSKRAAAMILEDWRPVVPNLADMLAALGYRPSVLPNIIELAGKRIRRDRPQLVIINAASFVVGDPKEWRGKLQGAASILVVPTRAPAQLFEDARMLRIDGLIDPPVSPPKLALAIDIAVRNHVASRRLRHEVRRLWKLRERLGGTAPVAGAGKRRGVDAAGTDLSEHHTPESLDPGERTAEPRSDLARHAAADRPSRP